MITRFRWWLVFLLMPRGERRDLYRELSWESGFLYRNTIRLRDWIAVVFPPVTGMSDIITRTIDLRAKQVHFELESGGPLIDNITSNNALLEAFKKRVPPGEYVRATITNELKYEDD